MRTFKSEYYELPIKYDKTTVKLLFQSPSRMYAYWDISAKTIKEFSNKNTKYENCVPYIRISNLTMGYSYEIEINPFANNYYIDVKDTDCDYQVELIRKTPSASFVVSSSNTTHIPRSSPCEYQEDIVFRNCVCLSVTDKFKIYTQRRENIKKYTELSLGEHYDYYEETVTSLDSSRK